MKVLHRGIALLLVLACVLGIAVAATAALRSGVIRVRHDHVSKDASEADRLLAASELIIEDWLAIESQRVVLDPGEPGPRVLVFDAGWDEPGSRLTVVGFDRLGMVTTSAMDAMPTLRTALPGAISSLLDGSDSPMFDIDELVPLAAKTGIRVYPKADSSETPSVFAMIREDDSSTDRRRARRRSIQAGVTLNVSTAPEPVLAAAMRASGRGALESILERRAAGEAPPLPAATGGEADEGVRFVGSSDAWSFRVDSEVGRVTRSWWLTYARRNGWELRARHAIPE